MLDVARQTGALHYDGHYLDDGLQDLPTEQALYDVEQGGGEELASMLCDQAEVAAAVSRTAAPTLGVRVGGGLGNVRFFFATVVA